MYSIKVTLNTSKCIRACDTSVGDLMRIVEPGSQYDGQILLNTTAGFASLTHHNDFWSGKSLEIHVVKLVPGERVLLTVE